MGSYNATFHSDARAASASPIYYRWDFDGDSIIDASGYNLDAPTHNYASSGVYTVTLTLSNDVGEVYTRTRENYIQVYDTIAADFSASITNNADAPIRINFTDQSSSAARSWLWEVDLPGGGTSWSTFSQGAALSNQNPFLDMTLSGTYTIRLTASCDFGPGGTSSDSVTRDVTLDSVVANATNHYVWKGGRHLYPFKSWEDAATNIGAACDAALNGEHVIVTNGVYTEPRIDVVSKGIHIRSVNGPEVTIVDSQYQNGGFFLKPYDALTGQGTEGLSGSLVGFTVQRCSRALFAKWGDILIDDMIIQHNVEDFEAIVELTDGPVLVNSLIQSNEAFSDIVFASQTSISNCVIRGNYSGNFRLLGLPGGTMDNCLVVENESEGCILFAGYGSTVRNCTIANNVVFEQENPATAIWLHTGYTTLYFDNTIMYGNVEQDLNGVVLGHVRDWIFRAQDYPDRLHVRNSCYTDDVLWLPTSYKTNSLLGVDPKFVDAANGNYRLQTNSPCVDSGYNFTQYQGELLRTFLVDFGPSASTTPGNWNNVTSGTVGTKVNNMVDDTGASSSVNLVFTEPFGDTADDGAVDSTLYPSTAQRDVLHTVSATEYIWYYFQFDNLNLSNRYEITFFASSDYDRTVHARYTLKDSAADTGSLMLNGNTSNTVTITEISAPNGTIEIGVKPGRTNPGYGVLGVIELKEYAYDPHTLLTNRVDLDGRARLFNGTVDMGAYELHDNDLPLIEISADATEGPTPFAVGFTAVVSDGDGTITNIQWDFGDGSVSNGAGLTSVSHTYTTKGTYYANATVTDNDGGSFSDGLTIIAGDPVPVAPTNFVAVNLSPTNNALSWDDMSSDETSFEIRRRVYTNYWEQIMDDPEGYTAWDALYSYYDITTNATAYGGSYLRADALWLEGYEMTLSFYPDIPEDGQYEIFEWHPVVSNTVMSAFRHDIYTPDGPILVYVNQNIHGGQWNSIGVYHMAPGSFLNAYVRGLSRDAAIDAYKFVRVPEFETIAVLPTDTTNYLHTGLQDNTVFEYLLAASNSYGYSDWVSAWTTIPTTNLLPVATILSASPTNGRSPLLVSAAGGGTDADGTITNYSWDFGDNYSGSILSGANLTNAQYVYDYDGTYTLTLEVTDDRGFTSTNQAEVVVTVQDSAPNAPSGLYGQVTAGSVELRWIDNSFNEDLFVLQRKAGEGAFADLNTIATPSTVYLDTQVVPGSNYTYRVAASNEQGRSEWSNEETVFFGTAENYGLPFSETFESSPVAMAGTLGALDGQHGWAAGAGAVVTNSGAQGGSQALVLDGANVSHTFLGAPTNIWIEFWSKPVRGDAPTTITSNSAAVFYVNTTSNLVAYSNTTAITLGAVVSNGWNKFALHCDYVSKVWNLELNDTLIVSNFTFYGSPAGFSTFELLPASDGLAWLDEVNVTDNLTDADGDGLPDDWERSYWGDTSPDPSTIAANGVNTLIECYIAGIDPTDPDAFFELSNLRNIIQWNSASGRVYTIYWTSNLLSGFGGPLQTNVPWTPAIFTDSTHSAEEKGFYKIEVELE